MAARYPFSFHGRAPLPDHAGGDRRTSYEIRFVTDPPPPLRERLAQLFESRMWRNRHILDSERVWRWTRGWALFTLLPRWDDQDPDASARRFFGEVADLVGAMHEIAPIADVIYASRIKGWPKPLHPWDEWTRRRGEPPGPPFTDYRRPSFRGDNVSPRRDETDPTFERARYAQRETLRSPKPKVAGPAAPRHRVGDRVLVRADRWQPATIIDAEPNRFWRVRLVEAGESEDDDLSIAEQYVLPMPTPAPLHLTIGREVVVESGGHWYEAVVKKVVSMTRWEIHYEGYDDSEDEEVPSSRVAVPS